MNAKCIKKKSDRIIVVEEKGKKLTVNNADRIEVQVIQVDGCLIIDGKKCDYILTSKYRSLVVELKGSDIISAIDQIEATLANPAAFEFIKPNTICFVIANQYPSNDSSIQVRLKRFRSKSSHPVKIACRRHTYDLN